MTYTAKDITVLEGLEPVRRRPGMYIGGVGASGLHHLVWEILDNSIDEAMNGHASNIWVTLHKDGSSITIEDDGRGIPIDKHPTSKKSALEVIFTVLHAGGKFDHGNYKTAGGLHGVGASVVNALSKELVATVRRDGAEWEQRFKQGKPLGPPKKVGPARGSGTKVFFHPDPAIFPKIELDAAIIRERLEVASYIHKGLKIAFEDEGEKTKDAFEHTEGLLAYLKKIRDRAERQARARRRCSRSRSRTVSGSIWSLQWTESTEEHIRSYVNGIPTGSGGTHENGLRAGLGKAMRNFIETHNLSPKGVTITAEDIREGLTGVLSVFMQEPQFQGQTKDRLNNPEVLSAVDSLVRPGLEHWLNHNTSVAEAIVARDHPVGPRTRGEPRRAAGSDAQERDVRPPEPSRQAERLHGVGPIGFGAVHRRRRLRRRIGEAGARSHAAGDSAAARQGAEHRKRVAREGAGEQGALRSRHRDRVRSRERTSTSRGFATAS